MATPPSPAAPLRRAALLRAAPRLGALRLARCRQWTFPCRGLHRRLGWPGEPWPCWRACAVRGLSRYQPLSRSPAPRRPEAHQRAAPPHRHLPTAGAGGSAAGGPAGLVTARRARRSRPFPWVPLSAGWPGVSGGADDPVSDASLPAWPSAADSLFCRSISSIRAFSPVRLPGAAGLIGPLRAARELFVRAHWCGIHLAGVPRIQARCQYLSLVSVPPVRPGRLRRDRGPRRARRRWRFRLAGRVGRIIGTRRASLRGGSIDAQRPLSQSRHHCGRRWLKSRNVAERNQDVFGSHGRCHVPNNHSKYRTSGLLVRHGTLV